MHVFGQAEENRENLISGDSNPRLNPATWTYVTGTPKPTHYQTPDYSVICSLLNLDPSNPPDVRVLKVITTRNKIY